MNRKGFTLVELLVVITIIGVLAALLFPALQTAVEEANKLTCKNNLKGIGTACITWATSHGKWPDEYETTSTQWDMVGETRDDTYAVTPTTDPPASVDPKNTPNSIINSNLANLWRLIVSGGLEPASFLCPSGSQKEDSTVANYSAVRDFRSVQYCSYSYQNVLGPYMLKSTSSANPSQLAVAADANPQRKDFYGTGGVTDAKLAENPMFEGNTDEAKQWNLDQSGGITVAYQLNSPNHKFKGQNVLYLDNHVQWKDHPYCGPKYDNIWVKRRTAGGAPINPRSLATLTPYDEPTSYTTPTLPAGGLTAGSSDDSWMVP